MFAAVALFLVAATPVGPAPPPGLVTEAGLATICAITDDSTELNMIQQAGCVYFVQAAFFAFQAADPAFGACAPKAISFETLYSLIGDYTRTHPQEANLPAVFAVRNTVNYFFPCN